MNYGLPRVICKDRANATAPKILCKININDEIILIMYIPFIIPAYQIISKCFQLTVNFLQHLNSQTNNVGKRIDTPLAINAEKNVTIANKNENSTFPSPSDKTDIPK